MIRTAEPNDLPALAKIYLASWRFAFGSHFPQEILRGVSLGDFEDRWRAYFNDSHVHSFIHEREGSPTGFVASRANEDSSPEILSLMVSPLFLRTGIGSNLMEAALLQLRMGGARTVILWVVEENSRARKFYENFGFSNTGQKRAIQRYGIQLCQLMYELPLCPI